MLKKSALVLIAAFVALNIAIAIVAFISTRDRDLSIPDTALAFQEAAYGGNYEALWELSTLEYHQGLTRDEFIEWARDNTPPPDRIFDWTVLNEQSGDIARAHILVQLASGGTATHRMMLRDIDGQWLVTEYSTYDGVWPPIESPLSGT